jgi:hypothetical protein
VRRETYNIGDLPLCVPCDEWERLLLVDFESLSRLFERVNRLNAGQVDKETKTKAQSLWDSFGWLGFDRNQKKNVLGATPNDGPKC